MSNKDKIRGALNRIKGLDPLDFVNDACKWPNPPPHDAKWIKAVCHAAKSSVKQCKGIATEALALLDTPEEPVKSLSADMVETHLPLRPAVAWFAQQMEAALIRNDHKGGWTGHNGLTNRLFDEANELIEAINNGERITEEAADVANFAMMIADNNGPKIGSRSALQSVRR